MEDSYLLRIADCEFRIKYYLFFAVFPADVKIAVSSPAPFSNA